MEPVSIHECIGVGFGPSNLSIAIALAERNQSTCTKRSALFLEAYPQFEWHPDAARFKDADQLSQRLGNHAESSIDIVSCFSFLHVTFHGADDGDFVDSTFLNYLHEKRRLATFVNLGTFTPSRREFADYLSWAAQHVAGDPDNGIAVNYGTKVLNIVPQIQDQTLSYFKVETVVLETGEKQDYFARDLILSTGGQPHYPSLFKSLQETGSSRLLHTAHYLDKVDSFVATILEDPHGRISLPPSPPGSENVSPLHTPLLSGTWSTATEKKKRPVRIAVIGSGQSSAECFLNLSKRLPHGEIEMVFRRGAIRPSDDTPFSNEVFDPVMTSLMYGSNVGHERLGLGQRPLPGHEGGMTPEGRALILDEAHSTNYAVVNVETLSKLYDAMYDQRLEEDIHGQVSAYQATKLSMRPFTEIVAVHASKGSQAIELKFRNRVTGAFTRQVYDGIILGTGYDRALWKDLLTSVPGVASIISKAESADKSVPVSRYYRLQLPELVDDIRISSRIWLCGSNEATHGISDSLISVLAIRSGEVVQDMDS